MNVLITGGAGFIGSHLANHLVQLGHFIRVLDDMSSGDPSALYSGIHVTRGDVRDVPKLWSLLQGVDVVYHLAARVSVPASVLYPRDYNDVNVGGTVALLEACRDVGRIKRVVLATPGALPVLAKLYDAVHQQSFFTSFISLELDPNWTGQAPS